MITDNIKPYLRFFRTFISVAAILFLVSNCASVQLNQKKLGRKNDKEINSSPKNCSDDDLSYAS